MKKLLFLVALTIIIITSFLYFTKEFYPKKATDSLALKVDDVYFEVKQITEDMDQQSVANFLKKLAEEKGGVYAYEVLKRAKVGQGVDVHLLGHVIGDVLYTQKGIDAMANCTTDFRNACSHSVISQFFIDKGESSLDTAVDVCRNIPGGILAYNLCFHGLGHGVLAYAQFDMPEGMRICQQIEPKPGYSFFAETRECIGGVVMEIIGGGNHDKEKWTEQRAKYLHPDNPLGLCQADFLPEEGRSICYVYLSPYLSQLAGVDMHKPTDDAIQKAFSYCTSDTERNKYYRGQCYYGFGKEFFTILESNNFNQEVTKHVEENDLIQVANWCKLAGDRDAETQCVYGAVISIYWGGTNDPEDAFRFCEHTSSIGINTQHACISVLYQFMKYHNLAKDRYVSFCEHIPQEYQIECKSEFNIY